MKKLVLFIFICLTNLSIAQSLRENLKFKITHQLSDAFHENRIKKHPYFYANFEHQIEGKIISRFPNRIYVEATLVSANYEVRDFNDGYSDSFKTYRYNSNSYSVNKNSFGYYLHQNINQPFIIKLDTLGNILNENEIQKKSQHFADELDEVFGVTTSWVSGAIVNVKIQVAMAIAELIFYNYSTDLIKSDMKIINQNQYLGSVIDTIKYTTNGIINRIFGGRTKQVAFSINNAQAQEIDTLRVVGRTEGKIKVLQTSKLQDRSELVVMGEKIKIDDQTNLTKNTTLLSNLRLVNQEVESILLSYWDKVKSYKTQKERMTVIWLN